MKRRYLLWGFLLPAVLLALWGVGEAFDRRPNPIVVRAGPWPATYPPPPAPVVPATMAGTSFFEVEVARERPLRMRLEDYADCSRPWPTGDTMPFPDPAAFAAEEKALRAALDEWLAVPGRGLRLAECWTSSETSTGWFGTSPRVRVVVSARLLPAAKEDGGR